MVEGFIVKKDSAKKNLSITMIDETGDIVPISEADIEDRLALIDRIGFTVLAIKVLLRMEHEDRSPDVGFSGTCTMTKRKGTNKRTK